MLAVLRHARRVQPTRLLAALLLLAGVLFLAPGRAPAQTRPLRAARLAQGQTAQGQTARSTPDHPWPRGGILRVAVLRDFPPLAGTDDQGRPEGFSVDFVRMVAERAGLIPAFLQVEDWGDLIESVRQGRADVACCPAILPERRAYIDYTSPVMSSPGGILIRTGRQDIQDLGDLAGKRVAIWHSGIFRHILERLPGVSIQEFNDVRRALYELLSGNLDAMVATTLELQALVDHAHLAGLLRLVPEPVGESRRALAVAKGNRALLDILEPQVKALVGSPEYRQLYRRWYGPAEPFWTVPRIAGLFFGTFLLTILGIWVWHYRSTLRLNARLEGALEAAEAASRAKDTFLANMGHEVRTPLNGVLGMLQLLNTTRLDPEQQGYADTALDSGRHLLSILNDILDFSRLEAHRLVLEERPFVTADLLASVEKLFAQPCRGKGLELVVRLDPALPRVLNGDAARLRQVLLNLVGNALKFTESGGIQVEASALRGPRPDTVRVLVEVADTGVGIPEDRLDTLCEAFTQADPSPRRRYQGAGLGLAIVKHLVELMGGELVVESRVGAGTRVSFTALLRPAGDADAVAAAEPEPASPPPLRILLAEDERVNQLMTRRLLEKMGHTVLTADNGQAALDLLRTQEVDCVLLDIQMPVLDGLETVRLLRSSSGEYGRNIDVPVIALTAHALKGDRERFLDAGMTDYLAKPLEREDLIRALARVVHAGR